MAKIDLTRIVWVTHNNEPQPVRLNGLSDYTKEAYDTKAEAWRAMIELLDEKISELRHTRDQWHERMLADALGIPHKKED